MSRVSFPLSQTAAAPSTLLIGVTAMAAALLGLCGCGPHGRMAIPGNAERLVSGPGSKFIHVTAAHPGRLHVLDRDSDNVIWAGDVRTGQTLVINGMTHEVLLDGKTVATGVVAKEHYVVFLSQGSKQ